LDSISYGEKLKPFDLYHEKLTCRIDGSLLDETLIHFRSLPIAGVYHNGEESDYFHDLPFTLMRSSQSGFVQLKQALAPDFYKHYRFAGGVPSGYVEHLSYISEIISKITNLDEHAIEIGSGDGTLLEMLHNRGYDIASFEPAYENVKKARDLNIPVIADFFTIKTASKVSARPFDIIIIRHVLEHIDDLNNLFFAIERISHRDTILLVEVPDLQTAVKRRIYSNFYHLHPCYFDISTLTKLMNRYGWELNYAETVEVFGGSILALATQLNSTHDLHEMELAENHPLSVSKDELEEFSKQWLDHHRKIHRFFDDIVSQGHTICGYGAGERTTSLLGMAGLTPKHIHCLYDRNPSLAGRKLTAGKIPIKHPDSLLEDKPDYLAIFARSYEDEIMESLSDYKAAGGKFITIKQNPPQIIN